MPKVATIGTAMARLSCRVGVFLCKGNLRQHRPGDVSAGLSVVDEKLLAPLHHGREIIERHQGVGASLIEPPVRVFSMIVGWSDFVMADTKASEGLGANISQQRLASNA